MSPYYKHLFPTPDGIMLAGVILAKRNKDGTFAIEGHEKHIHAMIQTAHGKPFHPNIIDSIKRGCKWFAKLSNEELRNAAYPFFPTPHVESHSVHDIPTIAKGLMELSLTGCNDMREVEEGKARMMKVQRALQPDALLKSFGLPTWDELMKDTTDDEEDDGEDGEDDGSDGSSDSSDDSGDSGGGNGHYNPDEPRIPADQPGGGQWTTGNGRPAMALPQILAVFWRMMFAVQSLRGLIIPPHCRKELTWPITIW